MVSPLIAMMKDQIDALSRRSIARATLQRIADACGPDHPWSYQAALTTETGPGRVKTSLGGNRRDGDL